MSVRRRDRRWRYVLNVTPAEWARIRRLIPDPAICDPQLVAEAWTEVVHALNLCGYPAFDPRTVEIRVRYDPRYDPESRLAVWVRVEVLEPTADWWREVAWGSSRTQRPS